jgi:hypothetical protein
MDMATPPDHAPLASEVQAPTDEELLAHIETFLNRTGMKPTRFGIETMAQGSLIADLRGGRSLSLRNVNKLLSFMAEYEAASSNASAGNSPDDTAQAEAA